MLPSLLALLLLSPLVASFAPRPFAGQPSWHAAKADEGLPAGVSNHFFAHLERLSRLVDITYCVGTTGLWHPFECVSRCKDFPTLELVETWNTGPLMSDSCGYIAVDHGAQLYPWSPDGGIAAPRQDQGRSGAIIVAFRGTYSIANTVVDLSTVPQAYVPYHSPDDEGGKPPKEPRYRCKNCTVHMGFLASWKVARENVLPTLKPLVARYPGYPIHLVGHSLGGAVAALAALEMKVILRWPSLTVTTFGEPRVGNAGFVEYLDEAFELLQDQGNLTDAEPRAYRRVTHVNDPVPLLPLSEWGYKSHAGEVFISKSELSPEPKDVRSCVGDYDPRCIARSESEQLEPSSSSTATREAAARAPLFAARRSWGFPSRLKLWELFFAHRDYFWRLGLCVPGGDPFDWGRDRYTGSGAEADEL